MSSQSPERLQKALARLGLASRREAEGWIRAGRVTVNGHPAELGAKVQSTDQIRLDGRLVRRRPPAQARVFLCHRSPGEPLRSSADPERPALLERLPRAGARGYVAVSPMPPNDGGLELVSADGALAADLQRRVRTLPVEFSVRVRGELEESRIERVRAGELDRGKLTVQCCEPGGGEGANRWYRLVTRGASGKDVRQLFERQGALVSRVLRTRLGPIGLARSLARGQFRALTDAELASLRAAAAAGTEAPAALLSVEAPAGHPSARRTEQRQIGARQRFRRRH